MLRKPALTASSRPRAPWYAVPADHKPYTRLAVARTITAALRSLALAYPVVGDDAQARLRHMRELLDRE